MCFQSVDDYDWIASVYEVSDEVATERLRCCECGGRINVGEKCRSVYMQRYEECRLCCGDIREQWDHDYEGQKLPPCDNDQHDYGETVQDYVCERCCKMIETIEEVENAEGCTAPHRTTDRSTASFGRRSGSRTTRLSTSTVPETSSPSWRRADTWTRCTN